MKPTKNPAAVALGKLGGKKGVKNPRKARKVPMTSDEARRAALLGWEKRRRAELPRIPC